MEPNESIYDLQDYQYKYYSTLRNKLIDTVDDRYTLRMIAKPSFTPEYLFQVRKKDSGYLVTYKVTTENIWYARHRDKVGINVKSGTLSSDDFELLRQLYRSVIDKVNYPVNATSIYDGVAYLFSIKDRDGRASGYTVSPYDTTLNAMIALTESLIGQMKPRLSRISFSDQQKAQIQQLIAQCNYILVPDDYKLLYEIHKQIAEHKNGYLNTLTGEEKVLLERPLRELQIELNRLLLYGKFDISGIIELVKNAGDEFANQLDFKFLSFSKNEKEYQNIESRIAHIKEDNLFTFLIHEIEKHREGIR
ncbi:hypothetical protein [Taibaiella koreensis]|uniref:hypothetical protein n=1 Tax=Taibaiella koreensis TaxID=1268548 RepID=UPI000E5A0521|nr:hypothetical protein [Taibaiella koreensis]